MCLIGCVVLTLALFENNKEKKLFSDIKSRLDSVENIDSANLDVELFADIFSGKQWDSKFDSYHESKHKKTMLVDLGIVFLLSGAIVNILLVLARYFKLKSSAGIENEIESLLMDGNALGKDSSKATPDAGNKNQYSPPASPEMLYSDQKLDDAKKNRLKKELKLKTDRYNQKLKNLNDKIVTLKQSGSETDKAKLEKLIKEHKATLEKQVQAFKKMALVVQKNALNDSNSFSDSIKDLMSQVSAIRDYAVNQQERVKKLQDGYDWNIVKTFALKIIRCIDNLDRRIESLKKDEVDFADFSEIRDEIVFALESSGIEQFKLEQNTKYTGQEKVAEAAPDKIKSKNPNQKGNIAQTVRPGYRQFIDDDNFKIIRPARVKLYA